MAAVQAEAPPVAAPRAFVGLGHGGIARLIPAVLLLPSLLFLAIFFALPAIGLVFYGFLTQSPDGIVGLPFTLEHYRHFFGTSLYSRVLLTTLRISLCTTAVAVLLGYPVALVMTRSPPTIRRVITMIVIAPLIVSVVVRTYGWQLILGNGPTGILNWLLLSTGLARAPVRLLYTETAVVIGSLHVFFPMVVLPLASALGKIDPRLDDAARTLGAGAWRIFRRIMLPLSLPGLAVGCGLVFSLTAVSVVTGKPYAETQHMIDQAWPKIEALKPNVLSIFENQTTVMQVVQGQADVAGIFYSKSVYPYTIQGAAVDMCYPREGTFAGINTVTLVKNGPERELALAFINWMLSPEMQKLLAEQTLTAPSLGGLSFKPDVEKYMAYPEPKMDEMGIFSPDWTLINPTRAQLIEKYNQVFGG